MLGNLVHVSAKISTEYSKPEMTICSEVAIRTSCGLKILILVCVIGT